MMVLVINQNPDWKDAEGKNKWHWKVLDAYIEIISLWRLKQIKWLHQNHQLKHADFFLISITIIIFWLYVQTIIHFKSFSLLTDSLIGA